MSFLLSGLLLSGCGSSRNTPREEFNYHTYWTAWENTEIGEIHGNILLEWAGPERFIYIPDQGDPLTFVRKKDGSIVDAITPNRMFYTDGGSTPQLVQAAEEYSPWKFAPAYMIHDWLFTMNHCDLPGAEKYDHLVAARIMAEAIKTQMLAEKSDPSADDLEFDKMLLHNIYVAVKTFSKGRWEKREGRCDLYIPSNVAN